VGEKAHALDPKIYSVTKGGHQAGRVNRRKKKRNGVQKRGRFVFQPGLGCPEKGKYMGSAGHKGWHKAGRRGGRGGVVDQPEAEKEKQKRNGKQLQKDLPSTE